MFSESAVERMTVLNARDIRRTGKYVLVWLQQTLRLHDNPCILAAADLSRAIDRPVLIYHGLHEAYPYASARIHRFIVGASAQLATDCKQHGVRSVHHVARPENRDNKLLYRLIADACAVVTDEHFTFVPHNQALSVAPKIDVAMWKCDASRIVPTRVLPTGISTTKAFRAAHSAQRATHLQRRPIVKPFAAYQGSVPFSDDLLAEMSDVDLDDLVGRCEIDHQLRPHADFPAKKSAVVDRLSALPRVVSRYRWDRNNPAISGSTSKLSPYLRFGFASPWEVIEATSSLPASVRWKFLDELLTWREWAHYRASQEPLLHQYQSLGHKLHRLLDNGRLDPRSVISVHDLANARSPDPVWNAAQRQWLETGWMHNNLRMYWSSQILGWTQTPEDAWATACYLNDRLSLDGRDPATYASMHFAFGESKPAFKSSPVNGKIYRKTASALMKRAGVKEWIENTNCSGDPDLYTGSFPAYRSNYVPGTVTA
jgi:deoxyribodipyrimidine photo-lyase